MSSEGEPWRTWAITACGRCSSCLNLDAPTVVESRPSHVIGLNGQVPFKIQNDYSFPAACTVRFRFAAKGSRPALDLFWYDGSMKPPRPDELESQHDDLPAEGMMFVGDKGKIIADFLGENPRIIPEKTTAGIPICEGRDRRRLPRRSAPGRNRRRDSSSVGGCIQGWRLPAYGDFLLAGPISDAFNLGAVSLRMGGARLVFDAADRENHEPARGEQISAARLSSRLGIGVG